MNSGSGPVRHLTDTEVYELSRISSIAGFPAEYKRPSLHSDCVVRSSELGGKGLFATARIRRGEVILRADGEKFDRPVVYSYQIAEGVHTMGAGALNHSCDDPTCGLDAETGNLVTLVQVEPDDELNFNYLTTEWELSTPFTCRCGSTDCYTTIAGFSKLTPDQQLELARRLPVAEYIRAKIRE